MFDGLWLGLEAAHDEGAGEKTEEEGEEGGKEIRGAHKMHSI